MTIFRDHNKQHAHNDSKRELRRIVKTKLASYSVDMMSEFSKSAFAIIEATPRFRQAKTIAIYSALFDELPTSEVIDRWVETKRIALPVVNGDEMSFFEFTPQSRMKIGAFGIDEPSATSMIQESEIDLIIVPGVAFDKQGNRLGRGKGYYDKYLSHTNAYRMGICTPIQLVESLTCEPHDQRMDSVVTPLGIIDLSHE